jgi:hypothetical protein
MLRRHRKVGGPIAQEGAAQGLCLCGDHLSVAPVAALALWVAWWHGLPFHRTRRAKMNP